MNKNLAFGYEEELLAVIQEIISAEQIGGKIGADTTKFGCAGTIALFEKLEKLKIIRINEKYNDFPIDYTFLPNGLLKLVKNDYLKDYSGNFSNKKFTKSESQILNNFFETLFFKNYFFRKIYCNIENYSSLNDLTSSINDLLVDGNELKQKINDIEYPIFVKASKIAKKRRIYSHQRAIQQELGSYFTPLTDKEKIFLQILGPPIDDIDGVGIDFINDLMSKEGFTKKQVLKIAESLESKGMIFKPRLGYYKLVGSKIKKWINNNL